MLFRVTWVEPEEIVSFGNLPSNRWRNHAVERVYTSSCGSGDRLIYNDMNIFSFEFLFCLERFPVNDLSSTSELLRQDSRV